MNPKNWNYTRKAVAAASFCAILLTLLAFWTAKTVDRAGQTASGNGQGKYLRGVVDADAVYVAVQQARIAVETWRRAPDEIAQKTWQGRVDAIKGSPDVNAAVAKYRAAIESEATKLSQAGWDDSAGARGKFMQSVQHLIGVLRAHDLEAAYGHLMSARRWEKDYQRTGEDIFRAILDKDLAALTASVSHLSSESPWIASFNKTLAAYQDGLTRRNVRPPMRR